MDNIWVSFELKQSFILEENINNLLINSLFEILKKKESYESFETHNEIKNDNIDRMINLLKSIKVRGIE